MQRVCSLWLFGAMVIAVAQAQIAPGQLIINEIQASNQSTVADQAGEFDDWIELYNPGSAPLSLNGLYLTDDEANPSKWPFPDTSIQAQDYLIIWADNDSLQVGLHAYFRLSGNGEFIWLGYANGLVVDSFSFGPQGGDLSYGHYPNGTGPLQVMPPTFSATNSQFVLGQDTLAVGDLVINEFMAENQASVTDQDGEFDDWIEFYNPTSGAIALKGLFLSDRVESPALWAFPDTSIGAQDYLIVWADDDAQAGLHAGFRLAASGEHLQLAYADGKVIDSVSFGAQQADTTYGRFPNGSGPFGQMLPTFSANNGMFVTNIAPSAFKGYELFPNPARHQVMLSKPNPVPVMLQIRDMQGRLQQQFSWTSPNLRLSTRDWARGMYLISLNGQSWQKLLLY